MKHTFVIKTYSPFRVLYVFSLQLLLIGIGVWVDSSAMQWAGFVMSLLLGIAILTKPAHKTLTLDQAQEKLNDIRQKEFK